jgi:hypothetical protein
VQERLRDNNACVLDDAALADELFASARDHLPAVMHAEWDGRRARVELAGLFLPLRVWRGG